MTTRRSVSLLAGALIALTAVLVPAAGASRSASLPTLEIALTGVKAITISSTTVQSGAIGIAATFSGRAPQGPDAGPPSAGIVRLDPGVTFKEAAAAADRHQGDLDALTPYGTMVVSMVAPGRVETILTPGNYAALNDTGDGPPAFELFTVVRSSSPAKLPSASATQSTIEFGFRGPTVLHDGAIVRARNDGYLVHMVTLVSVRDQATGKQVIALLRAGKEHQVERLVGHGFVTLLGPASPGAMQQQVLHAAPGYYVELCFMETQDKRDHTQLGMARLVRVVE